MPIYPVDINSLEEIDSDAGYPNASFYVTPAQGTCYRVHDICCQYDTDGNAANRTLYLMQDTTAATMPYFHGMSPTAQIANTVYNYSFGNMYVRESTAIALGATLDLVAVPILRPIMVFYPRTLWIQVVNFQVGDRFIDGRVLIERFLTS